MERVRYEYDGTGRKVKRIVGGSTTFYVYNAGGELMAEYGSNTTTDRQYLTQDHLGSTRLITRAGSNIAARRDYYPFGASMTAENSRGPLWGAPISTQKFTGKERDAETGLDYFGARYMSSAQGRFTSPDPTNRMVMRDPQPLNKYSYVFNRPLGLVDPDGRWPKGIHERIIDRAFPGLTNDQRKALKASSLWADGGGALNSAGHHLRAPGQSGAMAKTSYNNFVSGSLTHASWMQAVSPNSSGPGVNQLNLGAVWEFGQAMHAIQDSISPPHMDEDGNPQIYEFWPPSFMIDHSAAEAQISPTQFNAAVALTQDAFRSAFGNRLFWLAIQSPPPPARRTDNRLKNTKKKDYEVDMVFMPDMQ